MTGKVEEKKKEQETPICLVIMPFSTPKGYEQGHFRKIYDQILAPAIKEAGYDPHRIDDNVESTMIHGKLLDQLINAPMVLCDLSSKNPNVLYELGIRHAFDKPVVLVQEKDQDRIFDIAGLTTAEYRKERLYDEVIEDQNKIAEAIKQTATTKKNYSIMSLARIAPAKSDKGEKISRDDRIEILISELARKIGKIEGQLSGSVTLSATRNINPSGNKKVEDAEVRVKAAMKQGEFILNKAREEGHNVAAPDISRTIYLLRDAIALYENYVPKNDIVLYAANIVLDGLRQARLKCEEPTII